MSELTNEDGMTQAEVEHEAAVADKVKTTESHEATSIRRWIVTLIIAVIFGVGTFIGTSVLYDVPSNTAKIETICEIARRQNDVLLEYGAILTTPIPIPPDSNPALAEAIANRNKQFAKAAEFTRIQVEGLHLPALIMVLCT